MRKSILVLLLLLPLMTVAQNKPLTAKQSKAHLKALKKLNKDYGIDYYVGNDTYVAGKVVDKNSYYGLVTIKGKELLPFEYDYIQTIDGCNLLAIFKDTLMGFAKRDGHIVAPLQYNSDIYGDGQIWSSRGLLVAQRDGKFGIIDTNGRTVLPFKYDDYLYICSDAPFVYVDNYSFSDGTRSESLIRYNGDTVITAGDVFYLADGVVRVTRNGLGGLFDTNGREIVKCQYKYFGNSPSNGLYSAKKDGHWMLVDLEGKEHFTNALRHINDSNYVYYGQSGLFFHYDGDMCGAIDTNGRTVIPLDSRYGFSLYDSHSRVVMSNYEHDTAYIFDLNGRLLDIYPYDYNYEDEGIGWVSKYTVVRKNGLNGLVDSNWKLIMPFKFKEDIWFVDSNHLVVQFNDGLKGLADIKGNILFKAPCHWINPLGNGIYNVYTDNPRNNKEYIRGYADIYGNTTLTDEEYATMQRWQIHREEDERKRKENRAIMYAGSQLTVLSSPSNDEEEVFVVVEEMPKFPGGDSALYMYLCMNLSYPDMARENKIEGRVFISFTVEKDGSVSNVRLLRDIGGGCGQAAVEVVKNMPRWEPGRQSGKAVRTQFTLPIDFTLSDEDVPNDDTSKEVDCRYLLEKKKDK